MVAKEISKWVREHSSKTRVVRAGEVSKIVLSHPTTAEIRKWLRSSSTPRPVKCRIYAWLLTRQGR